MKFSDKEFRKLLEELEKEGYLKVVEKEEEEEK
jgi:hypothetical protein